LARGLFSFFFNDTATTATYTGIAIAALKFAK
jgi:hypothetical protein